MDYYLYFAGYDGKTEQVGLAYSTDQIHWKISPQPIIPVGAAGAWDAIQTSNPCVLYENGLFRMWYQGVDEQRCYRIGYAESDDGWGWQKRPDVLFERPGIGELQQIPYREGYHQPLVIAEKDGYRMYFTDHRDRLGYIRVATSADGLTWHVLPDDCLRPHMPWEASGLHYPWVIHEDGCYVMWYTSEAQKTRWSLSRAVSEDGIHWRREPADRPVMDLHTARIVSKGHYLIPRKLLRLFPDYKHPHFRNSGLKDFAIPKGLWGKMLLGFYDKVIYPLRAKRFLSFNNGSVHKGAGGAYLMYFQALRENLDLAIGIATSPDGIHWQPSALNILRSQIEQQNIRWCSVFDGDPHLLIVEDHTR